MPYRCAYDNGGPYVGRDQNGETRYYGNRQNDWPFAPTNIPDQEPTVLAAAYLHSIFSGWPVGLVMAQWANETGWNWPPSYNSVAISNNPSAVTAAMGYCSSSNGPGTPVDFVSLADGISAAGLLAHRLYNGRGGLVYMANTAGQYVVNLSNRSNIVNVRDAFLHGIFVPAGEYRFENPDGSPASAVVPNSITAGGGTLQAACIALGASPWAGTHYMSAMYNYPGSALYDGIIKPNGWIGYTQVTER